MLAESGWDNNGQYATARVKLYEQIFGDGYISAGGHRTTEQMCSALQNLKEGARVLDIGSGIGGLAFFLASKFGCRVTGVDLCENTFKIAKERAKANGRNVAFLKGDILEMAFPPGAFDVIMSRDTLLHLSETKKRRLFEKCYQWLDDAGEIVIGDYCRRPKDEPVCNSFEAYILDRGYDLHDPVAYGNLLKEAGFKQVKAMDVSTAFLEMLETELSRFRRNHNPRPHLIDRQDYEHMEKSWLEKIAWVRSGDMRKGLIYGKKG